MVAAGGVAVEEFLVEKVSGLPGRGRAKTVATARCEEVSDRVERVDIRGIEKHFIESVNFPFSEISEASGVEKGPGRPPHWEMVFWWTRKPLISARAIIAGCLLPENTNPTNFLRSIGIFVRKRRPDGRPVFEKAPHRVKPKFRFDGINLLDPFACFGSIPLEGLRLGLSATACDLLPVGYVFLKAVLEYPAKYGAKLVEDVKKWGEWVTESLREDPLIKELYDEDVAVCIGSWEVRCPSCGKWTPLVGNWRLLRLKGDGGYKRLAWMQPKIEGERVEIDIIDLNKILGDDAVRKAKVEGLKVKVGGKEFRIPESNIDIQRKQAICLVCSQPIRFIEPNSGRHILQPEKNKHEQRVLYVKYALSRYNEGDENLAKLRHLVTAKIENGDLKFKAATRQDTEKLYQVPHNVKKGGKFSNESDPDIPYENIQPYGGATLGDIYEVFHKFRNLFNPRQLLTLVKIVKLIREAGKLIEQEKLREASSQKDAFEYAEAITTYLAIALARYADYNSLCTVWNYGGQLPAQVAHTISMRGIAFMWNWGDTCPFAVMSGTGTWYMNLKKFRKSLGYLVSALVSARPSGSCGREIEVLLDDAKMLSKSSSEKKFDLVITDPPYYDDVPYAELSDFYFVWLKRALSDVKDNRLVPRFIPDAFFEKIVDEWFEINTQWEKYALSEVSVFPPRLGSNATLEEGVEHFQNLLNASFTTMASRLKENGLLVTYYAHTDPDAWKALLMAGWEASGLTVTNAFPIATESAQSIVSRGKLSMDTSIVVVYRKGSEGSVDGSDLYAKMVEESAQRARELLDLGAVGRDLVVGTLAAALAIATKYREVRVMGRIDIGTLVDKYVYPASYLGLARALARKAELKDGVKSTDGMFYLLVKSTLAGAKKKTLDSTDVRIFSIGTSLDLNAALKTWKILRAGEKESGAKVAKAKTVTLVEPASTERSKLAELLEARGVGVTEPRVRCTVDALHLLEYLAVAFPREEFRRKLEELKAGYPAQVEDALNITRIMAKVLPAEDTEKGLCSRIIEYLEPITPELRKFTPEEVK